MARRTAPRRTRYEEVIELIERLIAERQLGPGDLLPSRSALAELAGVSIITVSRALNELEHEVAYIATRA